MLNANNLELESGIQIPNFIDKSLIGISIRDLKYFMIMLVTGVTDLHILYTSTRRRNQTC